MSVDLGIFGEAWEAAFATATCEALRSWASSDATLLVPATFERATRAWPFTRRVLDGAPGFEPVAAVRSRLAGARDPGRGLLLVRAGTLPGPGSLELLAASDGVVPEAHRALQRGEPHWEWVGPAATIGTPIVRIPPPIHAPPPNPAHRDERRGGLRTTFVDTGTGYFRALARPSATEDERSTAGNLPSSVPSRRRPGGRVSARTPDVLWEQYGPSRPLFTFNTNRFPEPPPPDGWRDAVVLASGLMGLSQVCARPPHPDARVLVYDINPRQLAFLEHILRHSQTPDFDDVIADFLRLTPDAVARPVLPHEQQNADRQRAWYRDNRARIAAWEGAAEWSFVECNLWTDPEPVLGWIRPGRPLFFMYLDLFQVWTVGASEAQVLSYPGLAESLEQEVRGRSRAATAFLPGPATERIQLQDGSPFAERQQ